MVSLRWTRFKMLGVHSSLHRILKYVKSAVAHTDVPDSLPEFIGTPPSSQDFTSNLLKCTLGQRRRWLNGSFFAATYAVAHCGQILRSGHSVRRKCMLMLEMCYNTMNLFFSWFTIGGVFAYTDRMSSIHLNTRQLLCVLRHLDVLAGVAGVQTEGHRGLELDRTVR